VIGLEAVFCGLPYVEGARAVSDVVAIRIDAPALLDVAEDHFHVAARVLAYAARCLLQLREATPAGASPPAEVAA
jgi:CRP-like cAMP-binding protein